MTQNPNALSATAMAAHLDMSRANLDKLVSDGVVTRERDGRVNPDAVRVAYIRHLRRARRLNPHTENRARNEAAKARELELRDAQKEGFSILTEESLANITGLFLTGLSGLAARCSRDLGIREVIENEIFKLRQAISDTAERKARELEARM
jgi:hypothetical protein